MNTTFSGSSLVQKIGPINTTFNGNGSFGASQNIGIAGACGIANGDFDNDGSARLFAFAGGDGRF